MARQSIHIVGASLAGLRAAEALRRANFAGPITLIGDEPHMPYDRPPLSKQVLAGDWDVDRIQLTKPDRLVDLNLKFRLGERATGFDLESRTLTTTDGAEVVDGLLVATGARCRTLPGSDAIGGVHVLRGLDDVLALKADLDAGPSRVVVVGAGFIGAEVAATCRGRGHAVTLVEALPTPLGRVLGDEMGQVCADVHIENGVDLRTSVGVESIETDDTGRCAAVLLSNGSRVEADVVVVGIGVVPNTEWLESSGLTIDNGVVCDETCLAAPGVVAAGDVARWPNRRFDEVMRVEHWDNAIEQGVHAARRLLVDEDAGEVADAFVPVPWFWSDQYDRKIQLAGRVRPDDDLVIVTGSLEEKRFAALYGRGDRLVGVLGFNRPRHVMQYKTMIQDGVSFAEAIAAKI